MHYAFATDAGSPRRLNRQGAGMGSVRGFQAVGHAGIAAVFGGKDGKARPFLEVVRKGGNEGQAGLMCPRAASGRKPRLGLDGGFRGWLRRR